MEGRGERIREGEERGGERRRRRRRRRGKRRRRGTGERKRGRGREVRDRFLCAYICFPQLT